MRAAAVSAKGSARIFWPSAPGTRRFRFSRTRRSSACRKTVGAKGKNWLFFGSQHEHCNYFYREELDPLKSDGVLTRLDCAWSRDQAGKSYVQHKMLENAAEIWKWMDAENGQFFVCGDARRMAKDVDAALRTIIQDQGGKSEEQTNEYVEKLKSDKRYKRDVY